MGSAAKAQEPTMEEILASIRRIIADDDGGGDRKVENVEEDNDVSAKAGLDMNQDDIDAMLADFDAPEPEPKKVAAKPKPVAVPAPAVDDDNDILELTKPVSEPAKPAAPKKVEPKPSPMADMGDVEFRDNDDAEPAPKPAPAMTPSPAPASVGEAALISPKTNEAVANAFGSLVNTVFSEKPRTMDELVQDMLRPMLKDWLENNLPTMVETLVKTEIERISRARR